MAFVVAATWKARPGQEDRILDVIKLMTPLSRREPGNIAYQAQVSSQDPGTFLLYEQYINAEAYADHKASSYFQQHVVGTALPHLERRDVTTWETIDF
jgi:quinol monooxygenase YgiN